MVIDVENKYYEWLCRLVCRNQPSKRLSYNKLLRYLHNVNFRYSISMDSNRAEDGKDLRWKFTTERYYSVDYDEVMERLERPCSVLEMMIALSVRCEETIMDDPSIGDRTGQWFWGMIVSMGLGSMLDSRYDSRYVEDTVNRFLDREYEPNGKGGLFIVNNCDRDLRDVEIWYQLNYYLDNLT